MIVRLTQRRVTECKDMNQQTTQCPSCIRSGSTGAYDWSGEKYTNLGEQSWQQLTSTGADVPKRGDVEVVLHSSRVWTKRGAGVQHSCTRKHQTSQTRHDYRRTLRPNQTPDSVGALISSHPGDEVTPVGPGRTSTVHGCLVRKEGCGWQTTKPRRTHAAVSEKHLHSRAW